MDYRTILFELTTERSVATNVPVAIRLADQFDAPCIGLHAQRAVVCAVGEVAIHSLDAAAGMLRRHGVRAEPDPMDGPEAAAAEVLLRSARAHGADLLVIGSYGHSRGRELLFGGVTRHMLRKAPLPVLFGS